jgi:hypothetical protein
MGKTVFSSYPLPFTHKLPGKNIPTKKYIYTRSKRMVISRGKQKNLKPPYPCPKI